MAITYDRYGHLMPGNEAEAAGMTQAEFNELVQDPDLYQLEDKQLNESHKYELPK